MTVNSVVCRDFNVKLRNKDMARDRKLLFKAIWEIVASTTVLVPAFEIVTKQEILSMNTNQSMH